MVDLDGEGAYKGVGGMEGMPGGSGGAPGDGGVGVVLPERTGDGEGEEDDGSAEISMDAAAGVGTGAQAGSKGKGKGNRSSHGPFLFHADNPLPYDAVLVDEASMLDLNLARALIEALPVPRAADGEPSGEHQGASLGNKRGAPSLILVGDHDQLPSVAPGRVLRDMVSAGEQKQQDDGAGVTSNVSVRFPVVPVARLQRIFRQAAASSIVRNAHGVNEGKGLVAVHELPLDLGSP